MSKNAKTNRESRRPHPEGWCLALTISRGTRTDHARLVADLRARHESKADPLLTGEIFTQSNFPSETGIFTTIHSDRRELIDQLLQHRTDVTIKAEILMGGLDRRQDATFVLGHRAGNWQIREPIVTGLVTIATGPTEDLAAYAAATGLPKSVQGSHEEQLVALKERELYRQVREGAVRLDHTFLEHNHLLRRPCCFPRRSRRCGLSFSRSPPVVSAARHILFSTKANTSSNGIPPKSVSPPAASFRRSR